MTDLIFHHEADQLRSQTANEIPVLMYGSRPPALGTGPSFVRPYRGSATLAARDTAFTEGSAFLKRRSLGDHPIA